jgi:ABC-type glycerol-3-phosphate transport system substrate-binding protein
MKKLFPFLMIVSVMGAILAGCGAKTEEAAGGDAAAPAAEAKTEEAK